MTTSDDTATILRQVDTWPSTRRKTRQTNLLISSVIENLNPDDDDNNVIIETNSRPTANTETLGARREFYPQIVLDSNTNAEWSPYSAAVRSSYTTRVIVDWLIWLEPACDGKNAKLIGTNSDRHQGNDTSSRQWVHTWRNDQAMTSRRRNGRWSTKVQYSN
jgi:hypothetical protein